MEATHGGREMNMASTTLSTSPQRLCWHPTPSEVEAIVSEMRPVIDRLAAAEQCRLDAVITSRSR
jgi:hypothetical protein